ncbi:5-formyltetrahydrofolate cyclo-ligase-like [Mizuhopecten yessoensis]|uniref:5-formyltetrahydrofolate cyclo-ligase n=1 Tax=Mizuhopecten yessoensis TaxID=6573 RepID=A0A210PY18_MIZYE|nr:5-formyltetrahydrofolate cyclo-ligase-like [Mizuhopecten yessoensis]OWF41377.1 5-formyltetrahydrofolate cyclo-ligase [Mizuhopecten yessoensis]
MSASAAIRSAKNVLRKEIKKRVAVLSEQEKEQQSRIVVEKLLKLPQIQNCQRVCLYLNMTDEVKTVPLLKTLLDTKKECFVPQYIGLVMKMVKLKSFEEYESLPMTKWKIKQPADDDLREDALNTGGLDVMVMPGLGFTKDGARLGRGKGYYDTYLEKCTKAGCLPFTVALAFNEQICDTVPTDTNDIPIDLVLYPSVGS